MDNYTADVYQEVEQCQVCGVDPITHLNDSSHPFTPNSGIGSPFDRQETVSVPGSLSGTNIHAKTINETIYKDIMDSKLKCKCQSKKQ